MNENMLWTLIALSGFFNALFFWRCILLEKSLAHEKYLNFKLIEERIKRHETKNRSL